MSTDSQIALSPAQREAILELGCRGSGGAFDPQVMSELFVLGLIEVDSQDRRVVLTQRGRLAYDSFADSEFGAKILSRSKTG